MRLREDVLGLNFLGNHCVASKVHGFSTSPPALRVGHALRQMQQRAEDTWKGWLWPSAHRVRSQMG